MQDHGHNNYQRGHFDHGVGAPIWSEDCHFIASSYKAVLEPGMAFDFETSWYIEVLGDFKIEDQLLVPDTSVEGMAPSPGTWVKTG